VEVHEESVYTLDPNPDQERRAWVKYGGSIGAALDLTKEQRVVSAALSAELVDPLSGSVPFPDQVTLGGDNLMPGFLRARLTDRSSVVGSLQYRWPVWVFLDGVLTAAAGNVFGEHFSGFDVKQTRLSSGIGVRSNGARESGFELLFAIGSEPFNDQFKVDSFRLVLGSHHGF
jgi:outer membrane protein assembly factor BamA